MTLLHDAYTALLAGLTYKTGNEIHWHDYGGNQITIELIDIDTESYVVRRYYDDGGLWIEEYYRQDQLHGKYQCRYPNGQLQRETDYVNGQLHGKCIGWYENGQRYWEEGWANNKLHGLSIWWSMYEVLSYEQYYINNHKVTIKEWEKHTLSE